LLSFLAISTSSGSFKISPLIQDPGEPRGEYACKRDFIHTIRILNLTKQDDSKDKIQ
jgi:hypothetical protein